MIGRAGLVALALIAVLSQSLGAGALAYPPLRGARGRGTMRSMVEGAWALRQLPDARTALRTISNVEAAAAASTAFGGPPPPFRGGGYTRDAASQSPPIAAVDNLPQDVARSIVACWRAPHEGDEVTLRMSFRRDGSVFGKPRITYMKASGGLDGQADLANSIYSAIAGCTPLRFTPSLGAAIAGRIFLIRFYATRKELRAAL